METKVFDTAKEKEKIILIAVETSDGDAAARSLNELEELGQTAGAETVAKIIQNREKAHAGTYIGKGKIEEARKLINNTKADTVVCDDELSPAQYHNLEEALGVKVIDRTVMILDIFAKRASTSEGKLQVELAQLRSGLHILQAAEVSCHGLAVELAQEVLVNRNLKWTDGL